VYKKRQYVEGGVQKASEYRGWCTKRVSLYTTFYILICFAHHLLHTDTFCTRPSTYWRFLYTTFYILSLLVHHLLHTLFVHHLLHTDSFCTPPSTYWLFLYTTFYILTLFVHHLLHTDSCCTPKVVYKKSQYVEGSVQKTSVCRRSRTKRVSM
jgi:uncharacterized membrane protein (DUF485 family)